MKMGNCECGVSTLMGNVVGHGEVNVSINFDAQVVPLKAKASMGCHAR